MKKLIQILSLLTLLAVPVSAQTNLAQTTLNGAVTATQLTVTLTSATGVTTTSGLLIDLEYVTVTAVSGTRISVVRGQAGTIAQAHATSAKVQVLATGAVFRNAFSGSCTLGTGDARYQPIAAIISPTLVFLQACRASRWVATYVLPITFDSVLAAP